MKTDIAFFSKIIFLAGIVLLFISLFLDWYGIQVFDMNDTLISSWDYNIFFEWTTEFPEVLSINDYYKPESLNVPIILTILFIIVLGACIYIILFRDIESSGNLKLQKSLSFIFLFLLLLIGFYIVVFPIMYLFPNYLYFPSITNFNFDLQTFQIYTISFGYILQLIGFVLVFPYALHYYLAANELGKAEQTPELMIERYIKRTQTPLDIDKYIAEELENFDEGLP